MWAKRDGAVLGRVLGGLLLVGGLSACIPDDWHHDHHGGGGAAKTLRVTGFHRGAPAWVPPAAYADKPVFTVTFNDAAWIPTVKPGETVRLERGLPGPKGKLVWAPLVFTASHAMELTTYVFISTTKFDDFVPPNPPGKVRYRLTAFGTPPNPAIGCVAATDGMPLDGDADGHPGGNYSKTIETPHKF